MVLGNLAPGASGSAISWCRSMRRRKRGTDFRRANLTAGERMARCAVTQVQNVPAASP
jgi:hypothetical protein